MDCSNYLSLFPKGKPLMADRGLYVEDLASLGLKLNVPVRKSGLQLTEAGLLRTGRIGHVSIHI